MSVFSGRCDLADHILMMKHRTKDGSDKKEDLEKARVLYSDEMECFEIFKERTGGVIYQWADLELTKYNIDTEIEKNNYLEKYVDEQGKTRYKYFGKEFKTLKALNKYGYSFKKEIHFETLLDIIPYYPYIISVHVSNEGKDTIVISNESFVESEYLDHKKFGYEGAMYNYYKKGLQEHYIDVVLHYFNYPEREVEEELVVKDGKIKTTYPIDSNFPIRQLSREICWVHPTVIDAKEGLVDVKEVFLGYNELRDGNKIKIWYVKEREPKLYLG